MLGSRATRQAQTSPYLLSFPARPSVSSSLIKELFLDISTPHFYLHGTFAASTSLQIMDQKTKKEFFAEVYKLDEEEIEEEDLSHASEFLKSSRSIATSKRHGGPKPNKILERTVSAPLPATASTLLRLTRNKSPAPSSTLLTAKRQTLDEAPASIKNTEPDIRPLRKAPLGLAKLADIPTPQNMPKTSGKRKRAQSLEMKPESQQVFRGCSFCQSSLKGNSFIIAECV